LGTICSSIGTDSTVCPTFSAISTSQSDASPLRSAQTDTIEELAEKIDVPVETFKATVERYNELAKLGEDLDFGKHGDILTTVEKAPFYAVKLGVTLLVTLGGLKVTEKMQVLDTNNEVIPGLYAAGNTSGCFFHNDYPNIMPGLSHGRSLTTGWVAGQSAVEG
jgi:fumarate reductase flavoprotein subunit